MNRYFGFNAYYKTYSKMDYHCDHYLICEDFPTKIKLKMMHLKVHLIRYAKNMILLKRNY